MSQDSFDTSPYFAGNAPFIEELYERYLESPSSVDEDWQGYFKSITNGVATQGKTQASWAEIAPKVVGAVDPELAAIEAKAKKAKAAASGGAASEEELRAYAHDAMRATMMVRAYRVRGHLMANLDPLGLDEKPPHSELDPANYGFGPEDMDKEVFLDGVLGLQTATVRDIVSILRKTYCGHVGVEFMHIQFPDQKSWIQHRVEATQDNYGFSIDQKKEILGTLIEIEAFEQFLTVKYPGSKRFSIQGGDVTLPGLQAIMKQSAKMGVEEMVFGMPHRGRINVLTTIMRKPYTEMLSLFHGNMDTPDWVSSSGDVKYHLGTSSDVDIDGNQVHLSLQANPSHLEAVDPVVVGKVRAKLDIMGDIENKSKAMGILLHGDASFAGQGLVSETLALSELRGYRTGGTVHVIVNNQIGFTTNPKSSRFTPYPSDVAKAVQAPIFHVNGDDPEAVYYVCQMAAEFRQTFKRDVVIDIFCYRKFGHNESDEPMFTQPQMYTAIAKHKLPAHIYADQLIAEGSVDQEYVEQKFNEFREFFEKEFEIAKNYKPNKADWLEGQWSGIEKKEGDAAPSPTGVKADVLKTVGHAISAKPDNFNLNRKIARQLDAKRKIIDEGKGIDWATGEALAFGSLLTEGMGIRLSGQDCQRGTFSQRHSVLIDQESEKEYMPLNTIPGVKEGVEYEVYNSSLSEFAILGFEYGYSTTRPNHLTLWEAQFGDFVNGAQTIIDQFIVSAEAKWLRMSGLVMLLPHGYEGQGPEHSSARPERFLQQCAEDNIQVANCTTPANYYHILRRQIHRKFRKPLILMTPKSLLRHKLCVSELKDFAEGTHFQRLIPETEKLVADKKIRRVVVTSGKVYYDLWEKRAEAGVDDIAIVRLEQYYPFPAKELAKELSRYPNADVVWCQEEPKNMGYWSFIDPYIEEVLVDIGHACKRASYTGRKAAASPATGYLSIHNAEQLAVLEDALIINEAAAKPARKKRA